ncbi:MAG: hypothetical protein WAV47_26925 [Blastocatellia bacterium]
MRRLVALWALASMLICVSKVEAQGTHQFLGKPRQVPDQFTARHRIRYNTQGYDQPAAKWKKKMQQWRNNDVPDSVMGEILAYPGSADGIERWIDDAFDQSLARFTACGGSLAELATRVSARELYVTIMPSAFFEPYYKVFVAGAYYPTPKEIKVLNIYYTWEGEHKGWLRHARDLLVYEMGNYFAVACGIQPEPRSASWPCDAPPLTWTK